MKTACIFCGNEPQNKNKEHIFPQWLIKMTGFDKKQTSVGTNWKTGKEIVFNALSYTFPSCTKCNEAFGKIEAKIKPIVERLQADQDVTGQELELLLDWFDKIRISAWFGVKYMNKDTFTMTPKYYVNSRVGLKDRMLSITNTYKNEKTLNWSGVTSPAFMLSPTAITLRINNLVIVNCSSDFVVSKQLGFPYVECERPNPQSEKTDMVMEKATRIANSQLFSTKLYSPSITVSQVIYREAKKHLPEFYDDEYVKNNSYNFEHGIGKLFLSENKTIRTIERDQAVNFTMPEAKAVYGNIEVVRPVLELQIELIQNKKKDLSLLSPEQRMDEIAGQNDVISYLQEQIRQYRY